MFWLLEIWAWLIRLVFEPDRMVFLQTNEAEKYRPPWIQILFKLSY